MNIWQELPKPFFVLAPMEAVTDHVFRRVVGSAAPADLYFSEFTNATGWVHAGEKAVAGRLTIHPDEDYPLIAQIWCSEPEDIAKLAQYCKMLGYQGIDLNMGCPAKTAVKNSGGSAMIREPELAAEIIAAAKTAGLPVSVKTRLGYSSIDEWEGWISHLLRQDIAALTVHLRTKKEMSKVPAHWELAKSITELRDTLAPQTLLIANGDVRDKAHARQLATETGVDGVMIGRGIFSNIFGFEDTTQTHSKQELLGLLNLHLDLFEQAEHAKPYQTLKRFYKIYIRDFDGAHELRNNLMLSHSVAEARAIVGDALANREPEHFTGLAHLRYHEPMHQRIKAIVFDSDGTLVNTKKLILNGYKTVLKKYGLEHLATDSYIQQRLGKPVPETYQQILAGHNVSVDIETLVAEHDKVQDASVNLIKAYPETERLLREWRAKGIKLCLFTSGNRMMIERNFTAAGIKQPFNLFDAVVTADDDLPRKPEPDAILELLNRVDVAPEDAVVVGDHPYDLQAGKRAQTGLKIGILHGFGETKELMQAGADALSDDLIGLDHILNVAFD